MQAKQRIETRECVVCGNEFERVRGRGQPPKYCPDCRGKVHQAQIRESLAKYRKRKAALNAPD